MASMDKLWSLAKTDPIFGGQTCTNLTTTCTTAAAEASSRTPQSTAMQGLLDKLNTVAVETGEGQAKVNAAAKGGDEFKRLKATIAQNIKEIRRDLQHIVT